MSVFGVNSFTGGMNDVIHPGLLDEKTAVNLSDCSLTNGKINPIRMPALMTQTSSEQLGHYGNRNRSWVKWYERTYWSNNNAKSKPYYGGNVEDYLGIPYPESQPVLEAVSVGNDETGLTGDYKYCVTFVNDNEWEGAPSSESSPLWATITLDGQWCKLTLPTFPAGIKYCKIYRTTEGGADFYNVGESNTSGSQYTDKVSDADAEMMNPLGTTNNLPPPDKGKYLTEYGGVFFLAVKARLYFSVQGNPHAWPTLNFIGVDDDITGIAPEGTGILVFTRNRTYHITGTDSAETITKNEIPGNQGCTNYRTIACLNNVPLWMSNDGLCMWTGSKVVIISQRRLNVKEFVVRYAASADDAYYLFTNKGAIVYDLRNSSYDSDLNVSIGVFYKLTVTCDYAWYDGDSDTLFLQKNGTEFYRFGAGVSGRWQYTSPNIGKTELTPHKYMELSIAHTGDITVSAYCDGVKAFDLSLHGDGRKKRVKLPWLVGKTLSIKMDGSGELDEYAVIYQ